VLRSIITEHHAEFADSKLTLLTEGWDSVAVDVDDRVIFKFPRHAKAEAALRREAALLEIIRPAIALPVPSLMLQERPLLHSRHAKLAGAHLTPALYAELPTAARDELGETLGLFYAQLHAINVSALRAAGARDLVAWLPAEDIHERIAATLPAALEPWAEDALEQWARSPRDPYGATYGFFDGHGWNMAFDPSLGRLNGIYDFGDSGFGPLHQEFIYSNLISPDLTDRIISAYERHTGRRLSRARILLLTDVWRLWEIAMEADDPGNLMVMLDAAHAWLKVRSETGGR
jgi:Ser/Thr protein kinase RdoA (MazF antagonist)